MLVNEKISKKRIIVIIIVISIVIAVILWTSVQKDTSTYEKLLRDSYGGATRTEVFQVEIDGKEEEIEIQISPRVYEEVKIQVLFQEAMEELDQIVLGENASFDYVDSNLRFPSKLDNYPFLISWELSRYDVINMSGELIQDKLRDVDPENQGVLVTVKGTLVYQEKEAQYQAEVLLFVKEEKLEISEEIRRMVETIDEETQTDEYLVLPKVWNGKSLDWKKKNGLNLSLILCLGVATAVLLVVRDKQKIVKKEKERKQEMLADYPEIISQFTVLMGSGMPAKKVWGKVAEDYRRQKQISGKRRAAYEEILYTWQEMQSGVPEAECYERFAGRCELLPYMKMGVLLAQNLRKGAKGLSQMLSLEAVDAMEERKSRARRLGEEAGTKLLFPMLLMLIVVLAIVVVPAFWSAQI